jgi:hypothetical protein
MVTKRSTTNKPASAQIDIREALYNDNRVGPAGGIQSPAEGITRLLAIVADIDPKFLTPGNLLFPPDTDTRRFHQAIRPVLDRHPLARDAEVRSSGTGLHLIFRLDPPVELKTAADQKRWAVIVRAVIGSLPSDPNAPGITALTRPIGSINSKNGAVVELLHAGRPISPEQVVAFVDAMAEAPFRSVALPLLGSDRIAPCPMCREPSSSLAVLDRLGKCYHCGVVGLEDLFALVIRDTEQVGPAEPKTKQPRRGKAEARGASSSPRPVPPEAKPRRHS